MKNVPQMWGGEGGSEIKSQFIPMLILIFCFKMRQIREYTKRLEDEAAQWKSCQRERNRKKLIHATLFSHLFSQSYSIC